MHAQGTCAGHQAGTVPISKIVAAKAAVAGSTSAVSTACISVSAARSCSLCSAFSFGPTSSPSLAAAIRLPRPQDLVKSGWRPGERREVEFVKFVLSDIQHLEQLLPQGVHLTATQTGAVPRPHPSGCGTAQTETGPFYCPWTKRSSSTSGSSRVARPLRAPGEFAQAYVLAPKLVTTCKNCSGLRAKCTGFRVVIRPRRTLSGPPGTASGLLCRVWGHATAQRKVIDDSDVAAGLRAAASVGDDRLQHGDRSRQSRVVHARAPRSGRTGSAGGFNPAISRRATRSPAGSGRTPSRAYVPKSERPAHARITRLRVEVLIIPEDIELLVIVIILPSGIPS